MERSDSPITLNGRSVRLLGKMAEVGDTAPDFIASDTDMSPVSFLSFRDRPCLITSVPSLGIEGCERYVRRLGRLASALPAHTWVLVISMDLPASLDRWRAAAGLRRLALLSDHRDADFGVTYGVLIKEVRLLAGSVFVVGRDGAVRYRDVPREALDAPDCVAAVRVLSSLAAGRDDARAPGPLAGAHGAQPVT